MASSVRHHVACAMIAATMLTCTACKGHTVDDAPFKEARAAQVAEAIVQGNAYAVRTQLQQGADPNATGEDGLTLLQFAILQGNVAAAETLLDIGADPNRAGIGGSSAVHTAAIAADPQLLKVVLAHRGDPDAVHAGNGETPLAQAVGMRTDAQFAMLLAAGANPDRADRTGNTPLHRAAQVNAGAHVLALLQAGANPQAKNLQDATFQVYYFGIPAGKLNTVAKADRTAVLAWLRAHDVPIEVVAANG